MTDEALSNRTESHQALPSRPDPETLHPESQSGEKKPLPSIWRRRVTLIAGLATLIAAIAIIPPLINVGRYQRQVTALMSQSLGRPVHLSGVELRILPRPGFVMHDLTVGEDPEFGAEPVLSARTVIASVRIFSLWRGKIEISRISVDEASLNLVRSDRGRWNLESLMLGAQPILTAQPSGAATAAPGKSASFPYLEATNSRVNLKNGVVKSPFSLVDTDLSLWQDEPGRWRVRLNGQPFRTDIEMSLADTGEVRLEGSLQTASQLHDMPLNLQAEWREAQLGELSRLLLASDAGWRGDVTADIQVQGTLDSAQTKVRLRASGVRRQEFSPETPQDFDANCSFRFQHSQNALHALDCSTSVGDGRLHLKAEVPGNAGPPEGMLEVRQVPLQAVMDLLRTVRGGFAPGISAKGALSGDLTYKIPAAKQPIQASSGRRASSTASRSRKLRGAEVANPAASALQGNLALEGASFRGGALKEPLVVQKIVWTPTQDWNIQHLSAATSTSRLAAPNAAATGLAARFTIPMPASASGPTSPTSAQAAVSPASASTPGLAQGLAVRAIFGASGYAVALGGAVPVARLRELAYAFGMSHLDEADNVIAGTADLDLAVVGPWIASPDLDLSSRPIAVPVDHATPSLAEHKSSPVALAIASAKSMASIAAAGGSTAESATRSDSVSGTVQLHHAQWKPAYLASPVELPQGILSVSSGSLTLISDFSFGTAKDALKGSAHVTAWPGCKASDCRTHAQIQFAALDAGQMQNALLGAPAQKSLLSPIIDRMRSPDRPKWPPVTLEVAADTLLLGPVTLHQPSARIRLEERDIVLEHWEAVLLGGSASGTGNFTWTSDSPHYSLEGSFTAINPTQLGSLLQSPWSAASAKSLLSGSGSVQLSGLSPKELAASTIGDFKFNWPHGALPLTQNVTEHAKEEPVHFDLWTGAVTLKDGKAQLGENVMLQGKRSTPVSGSFPLSGPVKLSLNHPADHPDHSGNSPAQPAPKPVK